MNYVKAPKTALPMAFTLTTGKKYAGKVNRVKEYHYLLVKLLQSYKHMYSNFEICLEIFDDGYRETKLHYHGYMFVNKDMVYQYSKFLAEWEKKSKTSMTVSKKVYNDKWEEYIHKHDIISLTYSKLKLRRWITPGNIKDIHKWSKPDAEGIEAFMNAQNK